MDYEPTSDGDYTDASQALSDLEQSERDARLSEPGPLERFRNAEAMVRERNRKAMEAFVTELE